MSEALIALGSNLGNRQQHLDRAVRLIAQTPGVHSLHESAWCPTRAVGGPKYQAEFLNGAVLVQTSLAPENLFARLADIERLLGRIRNERWSPRTIDLDLLLFDERILKSPTLELPHPRMAFRKFVLDSAVEVAPQMLHPTIGWTVAELREHLANSTPYVAIRSSDSRVARDLAKAAAAKTGWRLLDPPVINPTAAVQTSTGPARQPAIEFPDDFLPLVDRRHWPAGVSGMITPFWLATGETAGKPIVSPRLLVDYNDSRELDDPAPREDSLGKHVVGPILHLSPQDPAAAEIELVAAIRAMS
jgi:2-amino-4-hydroxy-6-hydroxymethyldihydropteridine diphosphokinase